MALQGIAGECAFDGASAWYVQHVCLQMARPSKHRCIHTKKSYMPTPAKHTRRYDHHIQLATKKSRPTPHCYRLTP